MSSFCIDDGCVCVGRIICSFGFVSEVCTWKGSRRLCDCSQVSARAQAMKPRVPGESKPLTGEQGTLSMRDRATERLFSSKTMLQALVQVLFQSCPGHPEEQSIYYSRSWALGLHNHDNTRLQHEASIGKPALLLTQHTEHGWAAPALLLSLLPRAFRTLLRAARVPCTRQDPAASKGTRTSHPFLFQFCLTFMSGKISP